MNLVLLLIIVAEICLGVCAWISPPALRWLAAFLLTRADVIEAAREAHSRRLKFWQNEFGVERRESADEVHAFAPAQSMIRH